MSFRWVILALCLRAVARIEDWTVYLNAFDRASSDLEAGPLAGFIAERVRWPLKKLRRLAGG